MDAVPVSSAASTRDSLARLAAEVPAVATDPFAAKAALTWGWHAVALLAYLRLQPVREGFDAWLQEYLQEGAPALDVERDARWEERERLSLLELLDLLSEPELPSLKPELWQGWQDRTTRCRALRRKVQAHVGPPLSGAERDRLLLLLAAYHRLVRLPAATTVPLGAIREALPALVDLAGRLVDDRSPDAPPLRAALDACRAALD